MASHGREPDNEGSSAKRARYDPAARKDPLALPQGWLDCPPVGQPLGRLIPMKVPLSHKFDSVVPLNCRFTPETAVQLIQSQGVGVRMVLDLTNTSRYYDPQEFANMGVAHVKVPCRGRGVSPEPEAVNRCCWEIFKFMAHYGSDPTAYIAVHCTHGFNRTGYVLVAAALRLGREMGLTEGLSIDRALRRFAAVRPPGIYKDGYIADLFAYHHERRPGHCVTPAVPDWKGPDGSPEREEDEGGDGCAVGQQQQHKAQGYTVPADVPMHHDDVVGEELDPEEQRYWAGKVALFSSGGRQGDRFAGSQPVSLSRANMGLLQSKRYMVTWKADGTRYMLLACSMGCYLVDRSDRVRRLQMRFPTPAKQPPLGRGGQPLGPPPPYVVGRPHRMTLLDGEMVVDVDKGSGGTKARRFLAYDIVLLDDTPVGHLPFEQRFELVEREVMKPRAAEKKHIQACEVSGRPQAFAYVYGAEACGVRRKDFWPLDQSQKLLDSFIPQLCHEADGLILQPAEDPYVAGTHNELLKWKFASMNSVDFKLVLQRDGSPQLLLLDTRGGGGARREGGQPPLAPLPGARLSLPEGVEAATFADRIIECSWDEGRGVWEFMRERRDKDKPNAWRTYSKVFQSIQDKIEPPELLAAIRAGHAAHQQAQPQPLPPPHGLQGPWPPGLAPHHNQPAQQPLQHQQPPYQYHQQQHHHHQQQQPHQQQQHPQPPYQAQQQQPHHHQLPHGAARSQSIPGNLLSPYAQYHMQSKPLAPLGTHAHYAEDRSDPAAHQAAAAQDLAGAPPYVGQGWEDGAGAPSGAHVVGGEQPGRAGELPHSAAAGADDQDDGEDEDDGEDFID